MYSYNLINVANNQKKKKKVKSRWSQRLHKTNVSGRLVAKVEMLSRSNIFINDGPTENQATSYFIFNTIDQVICRLLYLVVFFCRGQFTPEKIKNNKTSGQWSMAAVDTVCVTES